MLQLQIFLLKLKKMICAKIIIIYKNELYVQCCNNCNQFNHDARICEINFSNFEKNNNKQFQLLLCNVVMLTKIKFI